MEHYPFTLPPLPYAYNSLEPFMDEATMKLHHDKHHQAYADKLNAALEKYPDWQNKSLEEILKNLADLPAEIKTAVKNHGGGHYNHSFFWPLLKIGSQPSAELKEKISAAFGGWEKFQEQFEQTALGQFGSGWTWLVWDKGELKITATANQDSPISSDQIPLLTVDVWEHAYYLKYQNLRADYLKAFWDVVNWQQVEDNLNQAEKS